jgi:hypothetical protein
MKLYFKEKYIDIPKDSITDIINENVAKYLISKGIAEKYNYQDKKKEETIQENIETQEIVSEKEETKTEKKVIKPKKK